MMMKSVFHVLLVFSQLYIYTIYLLKCHQIPHAFTTREKARLKIKSPLQKITYVVSKKCKIIFYNTYQPNIGEGTNSPLHLGASSYSIIFLVSNGMILRRAPYGGNPLLIILISSVDFGGFPQFKGMPRLVIYGPIFL